MDLDFVMFIGLDTRLWSRSFDWLCMTFGLLRRLSCAWGVLCSAQGLIFTQNTHSLYCLELSVSLPMFKSPAQLHHFLQPPARLRNHLLAPALLHCLLYSLARFLCSPVLARGTLSPPSAVSTHLRVWSSVAGLSWDVLYSAFTANKIELFLCLLTYLLTCLIYTLSGCTVVWPLCLCH